MKPGTTTPAAAAPWAQTASGKALALGRAVPPGAIDVRRDIAVPLGNTGRFGNQMPSGVLYSVAQHCNIGSDWIVARYHDHRLALAFLLHEGHEAVLGDWTEPVLAAMQQQLDSMRLQLGADIVPRISMREIKRRLADPIDRYLHEEAGLSWPLPSHMRELIHTIDRQMLLTERQHLLAHPPRRWDEALERLQPLALKHRIKPMPPAKAAENWILRFEQLSTRVRGDGSRPFPELARGAA